MPNYNSVYDRTSKQDVWWIERDSIGIALYDPMQEESKQFTSSSEVKTVTLFYHKKADHFNTLDSAQSSMTEQSELPSQFHQYIVDKAIQLGYEQNPDEIAKALYFENKFERGVKEGKTFKSRGRVSGATTIKQHSF
tara:strand:+ start:909 stop:1319 length:411 start_codon:yes stop_codon:yes gene_type:complete